MRVPTKRSMCKWIDSQRIDHFKSAAEKLAGLDGIIVAPGFGSRGVDGEIETIHYARTEGIPFFGICLGMQCAVIEFARNVIGLTDAHSTEIKEYTPDPVIDLMAEQKSIQNMGGTMRLGAYPCDLTPGSHAFNAYGSATIEERHRHRYEFNNAYLEQFETLGMVATERTPIRGWWKSWKSPNTPTVASQFHPEYASTVETPHPLFTAFVKAAKMDTATPKRRQLAKRLPILNRLSIPLWRHCLVRKRSTRAQSAQRPVAIPANFQWFCSRPKPRTTSIAEHVEHGMPTLQSQTTTTASAAIQSTCGSQRVVTTRYEDSFVFRGHIGCSIPNTLCTERL